MSLIINQSNINSTYSYTQKISDEYKNSESTSISKEKVNKNSNRHLLLRQASPSELHHFLSPNEKKVLKEIFEVSDNEMKRYGFSFHPKTSVALLKGSKLDITW